MIEVLLELEKRRPYLFPFIMSLIVIYSMLFYTAPVELVDEIASTDSLQFVDIDSIQAPKRVVKKSISTEEGEESEEDVERARGSSDVLNPFDLAFFPNVAPPKLITKLKKIYPTIARKENIEGTVFTELLIAPSGVVHNVFIIGVKLSKELPIMKNIAVSNEFKLAARKMLIGAKFSPPIINGKKVAIKMEFPFTFKLTDS